MDEAAGKLPSLASIWLLLEHRRPELAEAAARRRLAAKPGEWQTLVVLAEALRRQNRLDEAGQIAASAVQAAPDADRTHYALAQVRGEQGRLADAEEALHEALRLAPHFAGYHGFRAQLLWLNDCPAAAVAAAKALLALDARQPACLLWRAVAQERLGRPAEADADFALLLRVAPESGAARAQLGRVLLCRGQPSAAVPHLAEALRLEPGRAAEWLPWLRQAGHRQHWPAWLLRYHRQTDARRELGISVAGRRLALTLVGWVFRWRARWLTRRDPLLQRTRPAATAGRGAPGCSWVVGLFCLVGIVWRLMYRNLSPLLGLAATGAVLWALLAWRPRH